MDFKLLQVISRSLNANKPFIEEYLNKNQIHVAMLSETWLKDTTNTKIKSYNLIAKNRSDGKGGVAFLIKEDISYKILPNIQTTKVEILGVDVLLNNFNLKLWSFYNNDRKDIEKQKKT